MAGTVLHKYSNAKKYNAIQCWFFVDFEERKNRASAAAIMAVQMSKIRWGNIHLRRALFNTLIGGPKWNRKDFVYQYQMDGIDKVRQKLLIWNRE